MKRSLIPLALSLGLLAGCFKLSLIPSKRGASPLDSAATFEVRNLGETINTPLAEYGPAVGPDGLTLYFVTVAENTSYSSPRYGENKASVTVRRDHDIWVTRRRSLTDTVFEAPVRLDAPVNSEKNEGALSFLPDGKSFLFTGCERAGGTGDCDIYLASPGRGSKMNVMPLNEINTPHWDTSPTLSSDGNRLYFVSNRPNGKLDESDIFESRRDADGRWGAPVNIGRPVNSALREDSPCLAMGDSALFFASNRIGGFGGYDIYFSRLDADGTWREPVNLGPLFNTERDERFVAVARDGSVIFFSSMRNDINNKGQFDIFMARRLPP